MLTRDSYIAILEKRASSEGPIDNVDVAMKEVNSIQNDDREYLGGLFTKAHDVEKGQSKMVSKLFPGDSKKEPGAVLMKTAHYEAFIEAMGEHELLKTASPAYNEVVFRGFCDELEKIAALKPPNAAAVAAKGALRQRVSGDKVWDLSRNAGAAGLGASAGRPKLAPAVQAMRDKAQQPWWKRVLGA